MSIVSVEFAGFVLAVLALFYAVPGRFQPAVLLAASYLFAWSWGWRVPVALAAFTAANYGLGLALGARPGSGPALAARPGARRALLALGVAINVLPLLALRALVMMAAGPPPTGGAWLPVPTDTATVLIPVGVSFYVLSAIAYLVDVASGTVPVERRPVRFALFLGYFPKLLAGPIERAGTLLPQLDRARVVGGRDVAEALGLILTGLFRKTVLAELLLTWLRPGIAMAPADATTLQLLLWTAGIGFFIYNDFAGYTQVVRGISALFGIRLSRNFRTPLLSKTFAEFWLSWHATLSAFIRDYCYMPLTRALLRRSGNRRGLATVAVPPVVALLVSGVWHGFAPRFLLWGLLMGLLIAADGVRGLVLRARSRVPARPGRASGAGVVAASLLAAVAFVLEPARAVELWLSLPTEPYLGVAGRDLALLIPILATLALEAGERIAGTEIFVRRWPAPMPRLAGAAALLLVAAMLGIRGLRPFVYQGF